MLMCYTINMFKCVTELHFKVGTTLFVLMCLDFMSDLFCLQISIVHTTGSLCLKVQYIKPIVVNR